MLLGVVVLVKQMSVDEVTDLLRSRLNGQAVEAFRTGQPPRRADRLALPDRKNRATREDIVGFEYQPIVGDAAVGEPADVSLHRKFECARERVVEEKEVMSGAGKVGDQALVVEPDGGRRPLRAE